MRIRFKPWARPELEASKFYRDNPEKLKGKWIQEFKNKENPIHLELGCGKGQFISQIAFQNPEINYIAIDLVDAMLGLAKRTVEQTYNEANKEIDNVLLTRFAHRNWKIADRHIRYDPGNAGTSANLPSIHQCRAYR